MSKIIVERLEKLAVILVTNIGKNNHWQLKKMLYLFII
jgi:hypothetical protein